MNKLVCGILTVILCLSAVGALAQESDLPEVRWTYPAIADGDPVKYAMLVNADNMLEKDFEPDPLVPRGDQGESGPIRRRLPGKAAAKALRKCSMPPLL